MRGDKSGRLDPERNKFHVGAQDGKHYWLTPPEVYAMLDAEFGFDFDPAPYPRPEGFDGLTAEWGSVNYVNPPFGSVIHNGKKKGVTAWVRKAIEEYRKGKRVVLVYPLDKWVLMLLAEGATVRNLGDVRWCAIEDGEPGPGTGRHIACFILDPKALVNEFFDWLKARWPLMHQPTLYLHPDHEVVEANGKCGFAAYNTETQEIHVACAGLDDRTILESVAHEYAHHHSVRDERQAEGFATENVIDFLLEKLASVGRGRERIE